jgi:CRISPR-associated protein Cmr1
MPKIGDIPVCSGPPATRSSGRVTKEYRISLITPLFGGGVEAGTPDETLPIRGTSIRGQLRHWWRTTVGHRLGGRMWQREEEIFGSTEFPSPLGVRVVEQPQIQCVDPSYGDRFGPVAYALFSAIENQQQVVKEGSAFRVRLDWAGAEHLQSQRRAQNVQRKRDRRSILPDTIEDIGVDIAAALQAWCTFGGLGARSRRGCGAVFCSEIASELPDLPGRVLVALPQSSALEAWKESVKAYRDFRQSPRGRRHQKTINTKNGARTIQVPGRSHWPEADSIRKISGSALRPPAGASSTGVPADEDTSDHSVPVVPEEALPAFPRAILGLPINFHFADGPGKNRPGQRDKDPQDVQLIPLLPDGTDGGLDRMSSPVITRPLWHDGKWRPGVVILEQHTPNGLRVRLTGRRARADGADLSYDLLPEHVANPSLGALRPMRGHPSALDALRDFLEANGFREIAR